MPLDAFWCFAIGDIEKFCRIDWDSFRQKINPVFGYFVQCMNAAVRTHICICLFGSGTVTDYGTDTGYIGLSNGLSNRLSRGQ